MAVGSKAWIDREIWYLMGHILLFLLILGFSLFGQATSPQAPAQPVASAERLQPAYVLGPSDQIIIRAFEMAEIGEAPVRIDGDGEIDLPVIGRVKAAGLSVQQLEAVLIEKLKPFVTTPRVSINVTQFRSEPIFFVGAFTTPGIHPLQGRRTLVEMLSTVGGLQPNAGRRIRITRRTEFGKIPLSNATTSVDGKLSSVEIGIASLQQNVNPAEDIPLEPYDVISVEKAEMIYTNGEFTRVGAFELGDRESISVTQIVSLAGGLTRDADLTGARILRPIVDTSRRAEIPINITRIFEGKDNDFPLLPNDLLYVPKSPTSSSTFRKVAGRVALIVAAPLATTLIYAALR